MAVKRLVIVGAAGQARELAWYVDEINRVQESYRLLGFVVTDLGRLGPNDSKDRVVGDYGWLSDHLPEIDALALGIGHPGARLKVSAELEAAFPSLEWPAIVHPSARYDTSSAKVGRGAMIGVGFTGTVNLALEPFSMLNFGCTLGHEVRVGRGAVVNPGANISGAVDIGEGALIGTGAVVLQYLTVGAGAKVGAGAVVTSSVPERVTVVGVPARIARPR